MDDLVESLKNPVIEENNKEDVQNGLVLVNLCSGINLVQG